MQEASLLRFIPDVNAPSPAGALPSGQHLV
jgi:hypothetical protein